MKPKKFRAGGASRTAKYACAWNVHAAGDREVRLHDPRAGIVHELLDLLARHARALGERKMRLSRFIVISNKIVLLLLRIKSFYSFQG